MQENPEEEEQNPKYIYISWKSEKEKIISSVYNVSGVDWLGHNRSTAADPHWFCLILNHQIGRFPFFL